MRSVWRFSPPLSSSVRNGGLSCDAVGHLRHASFLQVLIKSGLPDRISRWARPVTPIRPGMALLVLFGATVAIEGCGRRSASINTIDPALPVTTTVNPSYDVIVYGATVGGIAAASEAAMDGKNVLIVEPSAHIGGMTTGGLSAPDTLSTLEHSGGIARDFYSTMEKTFGVGNHSYTPQAAQSYFNKLLTVKGITIILQADIVGLSKNKTRIVSVTLSNGQATSGKFFVDGSYEGDLLKQAGVSYAVGREAAMQYRESLAGVRASEPIINVAISPYVVPADSSSGLVYTVQSGAPGPIGSADGHSMAYNYRICISNKPSDRVPFSPPPDYSTSRYDLLARYSEAYTQATGKDLKSSDLFVINPAPSGEYDYNSNTPLSTDVLRLIDGYPEGSTATRTAIASEIASYTKGLFWFLSQDPKMPASLRATMSSIGYCKSEFVENNYFPTQLYVREARRMVGSYVMTQNDVLGFTSIDDSIGRGFYPIDSHHVTFYAKNNGTYVEGLLFMKNNGTYPISLRSILPKATEVTNLLVPVAMSASHIGWCSLRLEPTFMVLGQAAGAAASLSIDKQVAVQQLDYESLRSLLTTRNYVF